MINNDTVIPNTVLINTAWMATSTDRVIAVIASGEVIDSMNAAIPSSKVRSTITESGRTTRMST